ncbi:flagellar biosynthesis protein FliS [Rhodobacter veldkampii DSM 11550]|uniref:Flagellar biosynthesis protein FliS n=1 Tax=Phaeovulum veldkampii DSM 11550 TaxID=1185920 RepID=A0A2T4JFQ6_9RHOB|nr:flagellar protein FliS [Phaeovulum veldkampii]MBK5946495.1 flagellar biosynthesis protein FliS [Phaeovulum veldkampii DSM 11550]PTE16740.1 flagellar biosynthesis protein FliS [Phaeovulum veldkampii DSM 11550]TDQ54602.1 flagellar protein FliS [Phaeovulum veldkampii DSM 11550]
MAVADARTRYRRAETMDLQSVEDPHQIILVTLRELDRSLKALAAAVPGPVYPDQHLNRAFTAIYILQGSLDFEKGGEIADNLFRVYEFCRMQVASAFRRESGPQLAEAAGHIGSILSAWEQIGPRRNDRR